MAGGSFRNSRPDTLEMQHLSREFLRYYIDHYVCLWQVTEEEVVGQWPWKDLVKNERWYEDIILPAYYQNKRKMASKSSEDALSGLSKILEEAHRKLLN